MAKVWGLGTGEDTLAAPTMTPRDDRHFGQWVSRGWAWRDGRPPLCQLSDRAVRKTQACERWLLAPSQEGWPRALVGGAESLQGGWASIRMPVVKGRGEDQVSLGEARDQGKANSKTVCRCSQHPT